MLQQLQATIHHGGIKVAGSACGDGHHRDANGFQAVGIQLGGHVAFQHGHAEFASQGWEGPFEQGGFSCAWAAHQVEAKQIPALEMLVVVFGLMVVGGKQIEAEGVLKRHMHGKRGGIGFSADAGLERTQGQGRHRCGNRCCGCAIPYR